MSMNLTDLSFPVLSSANSLYQNIFLGRILRVKAQLARNVDVNSVNDFGESVLVASLRVENKSKRSKLFKCLLQKGADVQYKDKNYGRDILSWTCVLNRYEELRILLDKFTGELDIHQKDCDGNTPLHHATKVNGINLVRELVRLYSQYNLSVDEANTEGLTPYILARRHGHKEIASILIEDGNASPAQFDSSKYMSCREWSRYGKRERQKNNKQFADETKMKTSQDETDGFVSSQITRRKSGVTSYSNPGNELYYRDIFPSKNNIRRKASISAMSLIELTSPDRGHVARRFHQSQFDTTKSAEYRGMLGEINSVMGLLSEQTCASFRQPAIKPKPIVKVYKHESDSEPQKISSFAIIVGKQSKDAPRKGKKTMQRKKTTRTKEAQGRSHRMNTSLPPIEMNNKIIVKY